MWTRPLAPDDGDRNAAPRQRPGRRYAIFALTILFVLFIPLGLLTALSLGSLRGLAFSFTDKVTTQRVIALEAADGQALLPKGQLQMTPIPVKQMPRDVIDAVLSIEDRRFYQRGPIDLISVLRALRQNYEAGHVVAGGSTITQQLVKMLYLSPERTYKRKIEEAALAIWLERHLTKDQILTSYLNNVYLGSGATGFPAAAKLYFGKQVADLSLPEAAMLAGMISAPANDDPTHNLSAARNRASAVIDAMVANGKISQAAALEAKLNPATPKPAQLSPRTAGWFADWVYRNAAAAVSPADGAVTVHTTLDLRLQQLAANVIESTLASDGRDMHATQAALVAMRPDGAVVAMVGGRDYAKSQFNRAVQAKRQPGSAFKLFDYYAALRHGYSPGDKVLDEPVDIKGWEPEDDSRRYHGTVTLAEAFAHSYNAAAVRLSEQVGIPQVIAAARDLGLHAPLANNPSLALGTSEVTLLDLTSAYAAVRAGTAPVEPWAIASVSLPNEQRAIPIGRPHGAQHGLGQYQGQLIALLRGVVEHGTGRAAALPGFAAGKTGTAQDYRDAWFVGFTDTLVVGVWVGNDDHSPMRRVLGGTLPATIWKKFMEQANPAPSTQPVAQQQTDQPPPAGAEQAANGLFDQSVTGAAGLQCNVAVCQQAYSSFRSSDCSYQPFRGGPRRFCDRQQGETTASVSGSERPMPAPSPASPAVARGPAMPGEQPPSPSRDKTNGQRTNSEVATHEATHDTARAAPGAAGAKCNPGACQRYSSFRASDCTYQPYGGGPRRLCDRSGERTASSRSRERDMPLDLDSAGRRTNSSMREDSDGRRADTSVQEDAPDRDGPRSQPLFAPLFLWGNGGL
jgi:1A family penicillin-binding protein